MLLKNGTLNERSDHIGFLRKSEAKGTYHNSSMAKRSKPSSSGGSDEDVAKKKQKSSRTAKQVSNGGSSTTRTREARAPAASVATSKSSIEPPANNPQTTIATASSVKVVNGGKATGNSFLKSLRLATSQPVTATAPSTAAASVASKSTNIGTKKNDIPLQELNTEISRSRRGTFLCVFLFAINVASAAYIVSQHTFHNLAQIRCASTVHKLQLELSNTKDEMKLLRKAIETLEGGYQNSNILMKDLEGMNTILGSRTIKDHKQFLTSNELDKWQQLLKTLEEDRLSTMIDFNEKLKSLL